MPGEAAPPEFESFLVRIWHEPASRAWRGTLIHVPSHAPRDGVNLDQPLAAILRYVPILPAAPRAPDGAPPDGGDQRRRPGGWDDRRRRLVRQPPDQLHAGAAKRERRAGPFI